MKEYLVLKVGNKWPSVIMPGETCRTVVFREMTGKQTWKSWPCTGFTSWSSWEKIKVGDIVSGLGVYNDKDKLLSAQNFPKVVGNVNSKQEELIQEDTQEPYDPIKEAQEISRNANKLAIKAEQLSLFINSTYKPF